MIPALGMELETVRTVLQNQVNDIYVCTDLSGETGVFYTVIAIRDAAVRKTVTEKLNTGRLFFSNQDFLGSFVYESRLNLVFRYYHENLLSLLGGVYLAEFVQCKRAALNLIAACAESGADADLGILLLHDRNINVTRDGGIQFNWKGGTWNCIIDFHGTESGTEAGTGVAADPGRTGDAVSG